MLDPMKMVEEFHNFYKVPYVPKGKYDKDIFQLRAALITEEFHESMAELRKFSTNDDERSYAALTKELTDLLYVIYGTGVSLNLPLIEMFNATHASNMSKVDDDGKPVFREDGKVMKTHNYKPVMLEEFE